MKYLSLLAAAMVMSALGSCRAETWQESLVQNDLLAAMSWALFDMDPYSFLGQNNKTELDKNEDSGGEETDASPSARSRQHLEEDDIADDYYFDYTDDTRNNASLKNRQLINIQGQRPRLKVEIRMLKIKFFEIYEKTTFNMFLGTGATGFLDDILHIKERSREDSFFSSLEDLVSLIGVDGPACVHRMLCEMGAAPMFRTNGLFGELVDLTIRHLLTSAYADSPSNSIDDSSDSSDRAARASQQEESSTSHASFHSHSSSSSSSGRSSSGRSSNDNSEGFHSFPDDGGREASSPVSYLDAVSAGRHGANCGHTFDKCPISLLEMAHFIQDGNL